MKNIDCVGWRDMVGSVLMQRMTEKRDFAAIRTRYFFTSQYGQPMPAVNGQQGVLQYTRDLSALSVLDIIVTCQGGDYNKEIYPGLPEIGSQGY